MMLKTSSRKINPFIGMIKSTLYKNIGIIVVLCILALLYCPGSYVVNFESMYQNRYHIDRLHGTTATEFTEIFGTVIMISAPIFVIIFNLVNFSFLYKKSASDVFHAFPLTRTELLLSRMISGIISAFIPVIVCSVCYTVMILFNPWIGSLVTLLYYLAVTLVIALIWSSFSLVFVICAGSAFDLALSFFGSNLTLWIITLIADNILIDTLLGYSGSSERILYNLCLPYFCAQHNELEFWIRSVIYIIAFTAISIWLYNRRKAEKGGLAFAYKGMYFMCSVLISICGGYLIGMLFDSDIDSVAFWIFMTVGAMLTSTIYGLITNRGFKGALRSVIMGAVAAAVILSVYIFGITNGFGFYTKYIPSANSVKEVQVYVLDDYVTFTEAEDVIALHKKAVSAALDKYDIVDALNKSNSESDDYVNYLVFHYTLKGNIKVSREFSVPLSAVDEELLKLYKSEARYEQLIEESRVNVDEFRSVRVRYRTYSDYYNGVNRYISQDQYKKLLSLYWKDVQELTSARYLMNDYYDDLTFDISTQNDSYYFYVRVGYYFDNTIDYLEDELS